MPRDQARPAQARPTLADVARRAGVSTMTASRALASGQGTRAATRRRVQQAAEAIGYVPHRAAGTLRSGASTLVAAVVPSLDNSLFTATLHGLADALAPHGLALAVGEARYSAAENLRLVREFLALRPRGLVLHESPADPVLRALIGQAGVPVVEVGDLPVRPFDMAVAFANRAAARALTAHLLRRGRRRIALLSLPPERSARARLRLAGQRDALRAAGIAWDPRLLIACEGGFAAGAAGLEAALALRPRIDAVLGLGDVLGLAALLAARRAGIAVPDQLGIASFDDHAMAASVAPRLTALAIPREAIGSQAGAAILARMQGVPWPARRDLGFTLIEGESA